MGSSGGCSSRTSTVIRTANTPSENALNRSGVALWSTVAPIRGYRLAYKVESRQKFRPLCRGASQDGAILMREPGPSPLF